MATSWFDGDTLTITPTGVTLIDAKIDLYSDWKEWIKIGDNAKHAPAFDTTGGDPISATQSVAAYFFLRNDLGWTLKSPAMATDFTVVGNIFPRDATLPFVEDDGGAFIHRWTFNVSPQALEIVTAATVTQQDVRDAMLLAASTGETAVDIQLVNILATAAALLK